jgi:hypothetical protein
MINALRDAAIKNALTTITDKKTKKTGFVVYGLSPKTGGRLKSAVLGGVNPSSPESSRLNFFSYKIMGLKPDPDGSNLMG